MRALPILLLVLAAPLAAGFELPTGKIAERGLAPGTDITFEVPLVFDRAGFFYAKLLPTPGNAVNGGSGPNGTWSVSYALVHQGGSRAELGTFANSSLSRIIPVAEGEEATFEAIVHVPSDAAKGGPSQAVYVALAWRPTENGLAPGASSGAQMDEARAVTLLMTDALLPPPVPEAEAEAEAEEGTGESELPPVAPIDTAERPMGTSRVVVTNTLPTWFLVAALILGAVFTGAACAGAWALVRLSRARGPEPRSVRVPVVAEEKRVVSFERVK